MIFLDTGAFLAVSHRRDQYHAKAIRGFAAVESERLQAATTNLVVAETLTLLGRRIGPEFAVRQGQRILQSQALHILRPTAEDDAAALDIFAKYADQGLSFVDAVSFAVMTRMRIRRVFGFDRHFLAAGFDLWP